MSPFGSGIVLPTPLVEWVPFYKFDKVIEESELYFSYGFPTATLQSNIRPTLFEAP